MNFVVAFVYKFGFLALPFEVSGGGKILFTEEGKKAEVIYERYTVITKLLEKTGASKEFARENACRIEHVIIPELFAILKKFAKSNAKSNYIHYGARIRSVV